MSGLHLYTSNRLENLAQSLAERVRAPLESVFQPELILVQSQGMARWLKLQLAERNGVCSNCEFPFPRAFSYAVFRAADPTLPETAAYDADLLPWVLMRELPGLLAPTAQPGGRAGGALFEPLRNYLGPEPEPRKLYQLCQRLAHTFDQYLVYRPEMVRAWEQGQEDHWQAQLWRAVCEPLRQHHAAALQAAFTGGLADSPARLAGLPERVSVFGISALPPFYLEIFSALARRMEVNFFLLEPCREFWGYISSVPEQERALQRAGKGAAEAATLHLESGHRLLASMGKLGRDFLSLLQDSGPWQETDQDLFVEPGQASLLACLQSDLLNLRDRGGAECPRQVLAEGDDSVQVHACHSALRELEVLYDHLLEWFDKDPQLAPREILVMIPEIERYAPLVQGVFGAPEQERLRIPFSLADRAPRAQSHVVETFLSILDLAGSRLGAGRVLALLEAAPVRRKFRLAEADVELVRRWVEEVRIRWGRDQEQRAALGLPQWSENTWRHGLDRLLLGYAMGGNGEELFGEILPYPGLEGDAVEVLGHFSEFMENLLGSLKALQTPRALKDWAQCLHRLLETFFDTAEEERTELDLLRAAFEKLARAQDVAGYDQPVDGAVVIENLQAELAEDHFGAGYLTGGVTFCALKPMRSIPAKIICLLGMNDAAFPRTVAQLSFDLMAQKHRLGDRSSRDDDRYLFLETLISARQRLYISYEGQSIRDNREAPPSVVVSELLDGIAQGFELPGKDVIADVVFTRHRLQAFSPAYFSGGRLFSYSKQNLQASLAIRPQRGCPAELLAHPLPEPEPEWRTVTLQALADFFCHPAKFLATRRLGLRLPGTDEALEEREPFSLEGLERYQLQDELLRLKLKGGSPLAAQSVMQAEGRLPAGPAGAAHYFQAGCAVEAFYKRLSRFGPGAAQPASFIELEIGPYHLSGEISHATADGLLFYRMADVKAKDLLRAWIEHLAWCAGPTGGGSSVIVGTQSTWTLHPVNEALACLHALLDLYWVGMCRPLRFFPESSLAFARAESKLGGAEPKPGAKTPLDHAAAKWIGNDFGAAGECTDEYYALFFKDGRALGEDFAANARLVFGPLLELAAEEPA